MSLFGHFLGEDHSNMATMLLGVLAQQGGHAENPEDVTQSSHALAGGARELLSRFQNGGLGEITQDMMHGEDTQLNPDEVHRVLGSDVIGNLAEKFGLPHEQVTNVISEFLPGLVDALTPNNRPPQGGDEVAHFLPDENRTVET